MRDQRLIRLRVQWPAVAAGRLAADDLVLPVRQVQTAVEQIIPVLRGGQGLRPGGGSCDLALMTLNGRQFKNMLGLKLIP